MIWLPTPQFASIRAIVGYLSKTLFQSTYKFKLRIVDPARINFCVSARVHICDKDSCFDGVPFDDPPHHPQLNYYNGNVEKIVISCWFLVELWTKMIHLINRMRNHLSQAKLIIIKDCIFLFGDMCVVSINLLLVELLPVATL